MVTVPVTRLKGLKTHIQSITRVLEASRKVTMSVLLNLRQVHLPFLKEQEPSLRKRVHTFLPAWWKKKQETQTTSKIQRFPNRVTERVGNEESCTL